MDLRGTMRRGFDVLLISRTIRPRRIAQGALGGACAFVRSRRVQSAVLSRSAGTAAAILLIAFALAASVRPLKAEEIDALLAAVNGKVITEGDLRLARGLNTVIALGHSAAPPARTAEIERLIDLELIRQELGSFPMAADDQGSVETRIQGLRNAYAEIGGLPALLSRLGLQVSELQDYVRLQDSILRFVDFRFRPFATVSQQEVQDYYDGKLVPSLRKVNAPIPPLADVSSKIEEILKEEKVNALMTQWLQDIRRHSRIEYFFESADSAQGSKR